MSFERERIERIIGAGIPPEFVARGDLWAATCAYRDHVRRLLAGALNIKRDPQASRERKRDADRMIEACMCAVDCITDDMFAARSTAENADALQAANETVEFGLGRLAAALATQSTGKLMHGSSKSLPVAEGGEVDQAQLSKQEVDP
jgi:hypothetical protein